MPRFPHWHLLLPAAASVVVLWSARGALGDAPDLSGDNPFHIGSAEEIADAMEEGRDPFAAMPQAFGIPVLRFYQCLTYLAVGAVRLVTGLPTKDVLVWLVTLFVAASPFAYFSMMRSLGAAPGAAAIAGLLAVSSNSAFSHSMGAYYETGIVTQAIGSVFLPLFVGSFAKVLRGEGGAVRAAVHFSLAALSHAALMVYAMLVGLLALVALPFRVRVALPRVATFGVVSAILVAFWVVPFVSSTQADRPVSDLVVRPRHAVWHVGASPGELLRLAASGRLLDGPGTPRTPVDDLAVRINGGFTLPSRVPFLSILALLGFVFVLPRIGKDPERFFVAGTFLSVLVLLGPDDFPVGRWLFYRAHAFRATLLVDFFVVGVVALGLHRAVASALDWIGRRRAEAARAARAVVAVGTAAAVVAYAWIMIPLGEAMAQPTVWTTIPPAIQALGRVSPRASAGRWTVQFGGSRREHRIKDFLLSLGRPTGHHMSALGPLTTYYLGREVLTRAEKQYALARLVGLRYLLVDRAAARELAAATAPDGSPRFRRMVPGRLEVWRTTDDAQLHAPQGPRVAVVARDAQWVWLVERWMRRHAADALDPQVAWPMRVRPGELESAMRGRMVDAVLLADAGAPAPGPQLTRFVRGGGLVLSTRRVPGVDARVLDRRAESWEAAVAALPSHESQAVLKTRSARLGGPYAFSIRASGPSLLVLPEHHYENWKVQVDRHERNAWAVGPDLVGVVVPAAARDVRFEWRTSSTERWTLVLSSVGWAVVLAGASVRVAKKLRDLRRAKSGSGHGDATG